jgi:hypothetical protein
MAQAGLPSKLVHASTAIEIERTQVGNDLADIEVAKRITASRTAPRFMSSATDGRMGIPSYRNSLQV